jgi:hypothetical protein
VHNQVWIKESLEHEESSRHVPFVRYQPTWTANLKSTLDCALFADDCRSNVIVTINKTWLTIFTQDGERRTERREETKGGGRSPEFTPKSRKQTSRRSQPQNQRRDFDYAGDPTDAVSSIKELWAADTAHTQGGRRRHQRQK